MCRITATPSTPLPPPTSPVAGTSQEILSSRAKREGADVTERATEGSWFFCGWFFCGCLHKLVLLVLSHFLFPKKKGRLSPVPISRFPDHPMLTIALLVDSPAANPAASVPVAAWRRPSAVCSC